jgi:hypothetical protein
MFCLLDDVLAFQEGPSVMQLHVNVVTAESWKLRRVLCSICGTLSVRKMRRVLC